jgi:hypothetical protein
MPTQPRSRASVAESSQAAASQRSRPLLGGGEQLARTAQPARGPADKFHPQSLDDVRRALGPIAREIHQRTEQLDEDLRGERVVIEATLLPNYLAASHHPEDLRADANLVPVGTRNSRGTLRTKKQTKEGQPTKTLLLAATDQALERLDALLNDDNATADDKVLKDLVKLQDLVFPDERRLVTRRRDEDFDQEDVVTWEAVLHPAIGADGRLSDRVQALVMERWHKLVTAQDGRIHDDYIRRVGNLTFMPVSLRRGALDTISTFNPLRVLRPMPRMRSMPTSGLRRIDPGATPPTPPTGPAPTQRVAVFDGGAGSHPLLDPYVAHGDLTTAAPDQDDEDHGTLVTSALLYGHLHLGGQLATPPAEVDHFRVLPRPPEVSFDDEAYWVMDQIVDRVESDDRWKIVSLSYGPDEPVDEDSEPNRFTAEVDRLAYDRDVTFLVAVGNLQEDERASRSPLGLDRVKAPADGVNAIGVGACTTPNPSEPERSDYSCWGPGRPGLRLAPLGVAFGGDQNGQQFVGAAPGGGFQADAGTSYATPYAARGLATLLNELPPEHHHVNVTRAFAAHFAQAPADRHLDAVGYGRLPQDFVEHLECPEGSVTVLITDTLERGTTQAYPLPLPSAGLTGRLKLRWTVSFATPVDPEDAAEYTLAGVETAFRPSITRYRLDPPNPSAGRARDVDAVDDKDLIAERVQAGWRLSTNAKTRSGTALRSEHVRRDAGLWETVVRYETGALARSLNRPEIWLTYYERAQGQLVPRANAAQLDVAVLMTVEAPKVPDLYERVRAQADFRVLTPVVTSVPVSVEV